MLPLLGKRVLITRTREQSSGLREMLEAQGAEVLAIPSIQIVPPDSFAALDAALSQISSYDWLVLTSVNAVHAMRDRAHHLSIPLSGFKQIQVAAIGNATAQAVTSEGMVVALIPPRAVAESLAEELWRHVRDKRVLLIRAKVARDLLPDALREAGAAVTIAEAYQTILPPHSAEQLRAAFAQRIEAITFTSASSARNLFELAAAAGLSLPPELKKISIGPITSKAIEELGWQVAAEAQHATIERLVEAVIRACSHR